MQAVGVVEASDDKEHEAHRQSVKTINAGLADLNFYMTTFTTAHRESAEALTCICRTFNKLNAHVGTRVQGDSAGAAEGAAPMGHSPELDEVAQKLMEASAALEKVRACARACVRLCGCVYVLLLLLLRWLLLLMVDGVVVAVAYPGFRGRTVRCARAVRKVGCSPPPGVR